jgi:tetratricopeptide (TPR) repeat protein
MRPLTPKEAGAFWLARTPAEMVRHPVSELRRTGTKVLATYAGDPLPHEAGASFLREVSDSRVLDILVWAGRILIPLGLWGLVWRRKQAGWVLAVAALSGLVASLITFATPFARLLTLVACGAGFGMWLGAMVRGPSRWRGAAGSVLALGLWGVLPLHGGVPGLGIQGDDYYFLGAVYDQEQRGSAAMREYERSIRMDPLNPFPQIAIASMLARDNVNEEAARQLEQYRALHPDYPPVLFALVHLYQSQQRWLDAANVYGELIRIEPWNPEHLNNLGTVYVQIGYYDQAMRALDSALELDPGYTSARDNRALLLSMGVTDPKGVASPRLDPVERAQEAVLSLMKQGNFPAARDSLEAAYARYGRGRLDLRFLEGTLKLVSGDSEGAVAAYEPIRDRMGKNVIFLFNLGAAYQNLGRLAEAKSAFEAAARIQPTNERVRRSLAEVDAALDSLQTRP